jgi:hypothetical protein
MTSDWQRSPWHCRSCKSQILHSRKCTPSFRHRCLGSAFWFKAGISEVNSRMQKNLRLVVCGKLTPLFQDCCRLLAFSAVGFAQ